MAGKAKKAGRGVVWVLMALLILGLGGFGVANFSGQVRSVGTVGDKDIPVDTYVQSLQQDLRAIEAQTGQQLTFAQAREYGLTEATLSRVITDRAVDNESDRLGISVGDAVLSEQLREIQAFQGLDGSFDRETYRAALQQAGMNESGFEERLREETARTILQGAVVSGITMPETYADTIVGYVGERRTITWARLDERNLDAPVADPSEEELQAWYEENIDRYMEPEKKRITYAWLAPEMIADLGAVTTEDLQELFEARSDEYQQPERRLVERLVFPDEAAADKARTRLDAGEVDFETLVEERGLELADIDMGDMTEARLGEAGQAVFAAQSGDIVGPLPTDLGPALFRVNGILAAKTTSLEDASLALREEIATERARRQVDGESEAVEDLLAGGATLEEIADETPMELGTIDWYPGMGGGGIAEAPGFGAAAEALAPDAFPELIRLGDEGIAAMRLEDTIAAEPKPFEEVRDRVRTAWQTERTMARLVEQAEAQAARLRESANFASLGLETQTEQGLTRNGSVTGTGQDFVEKVFAMEPGEVMVTSGFGAVQIVRLDEVLGPDTDDASVDQLAASLRNQAAQSISNEIFRAYADTIRNDVGVRLNQDALNAVHSSFQ